MYIVNHILLIEFVNLRRFIVAITHVSLLLVTIHNHTKTSKKIQKNINSKKLKAETKKKPRENHSYSQDTNTNNKLSFYPSTATSFQTNITFLQFFDDPI